MTFEQAGDFLRPCLLLASKISRDLISLRAHGNGREFFPQYLDPGFILGDVFQMPINGVVVDCGNRSRWIMLDGEQQLITVFGNKFTYGGKIHQWHGTVFVNALERIDRIAFIAPANSGDGETAGYRLPP